MKSVWLIVLPVLVVAWQREDEALLMYNNSDLSLQPDTLIFPGSAKQHFRVLAAHAQNIVLGARNKLYNMSVPTMQIEKELTWINPRCNTSIENSACDNYIRVAAWRDDSRLLVCATRPDSKHREPRCRDYTIDSNNYRVVSSADRSGRGLAPYSPEEPVVHTSSGSRLFSAVRIEESPSLKSVISGVDDSWTYVLTEVRKQALYDPIFAHSIKYKDKIYFFYRERAIEGQICLNEMTYSRVAQVCEKDVGGSPPLNGKWTSFFKARLRCAVPNSNKYFYFDHLVSVSDVATSSGDDLVYAAFNTAENSITGSAVCAFRMKDIEGAFEGPLAVLTPTGWQKTSPSDKYPEPTQCVNDSRSIDFNQLNSLDVHRLMFDAVPSVRDEPLLVRTLTDERLTYIVVDPGVRAADGSVHDVIFVATDKGRVHKLSVRHGTSALGEPTFLETLQVLENTAITQLSIMLEGNKRLLVISPDRVTSLPVHRCGKLDSCSDCVASRDPYCSWHQASGQQQASCRWSTSGLQNTTSGIHSLCPSSTSSTTSDTTSQTTSSASSSVTSVTSSVTEPSSTALSCPPPLPCVCPTPVLPASPTPDTRNSTRTTTVVEETPLSESLVVPDNDTVSTRTLAIAVSLSVLLCLTVGFALGVLFMRCRQGKLYTKLLHRKPVNQNTYMEPKVERQQTAAEPSPAIAGSVGLRRPNRPPPLQLIPTSTADQLLSAPVNESSSPTTATSYLYRTPSVNAPLHHSLPHKPSTTVNRVPSTPANHVTATPVRRVPSTPTRLIHTPKQVPHTPTFIPQSNVPTPLPPSPTKPAHAPFPPTPTKLAHTPFPPTPTKLGSPVSTKVPPTPTNISQIPPALTKDLNINVLRNDVNVNTLNSSSSGSMNSSFVDGNVLNMSTLERTKRSNKIYV